MHRYLLLALLIPLQSMLWAQDSLLAEEVFDEVAVELNTDSLEATFQYQTGRVMIADWTVTLELPDSLKFLAGDQARQLLVDIWKNPPSLADGMEGVIMYADAGAFDARSAFIVYYDSSGYVSDEDADAINYDTMLANMLREDSAENAAREAAGYDRLELVGWASPPYYDKQNKVLHWAKEMSQPDVEDNVLNYNIRVLGRKGVIIINGITGMSRLEVMKTEVPVMCRVVTFNQGFRYQDFDPATDKESRQSLSGLIDGKAKEKVMGFLKLFVKVAAIALVSMVAIIVLIVFLVRRSRKAPMS